jgi:hypothetical protein
MNRNERQAQTEDGRALLGRADKFPHDKPLKPGLAVEFLVIPEKKNQHIEGKL